jgi:hypothetical protein
MKLVLKQTKGRTGGGSDLQLPHTNGAGPCLAARLKAVSKLEFLASHLVINFPKKIVFCSVFQATQENRPISVVLARFYL